MSISVVGIGNILMSDEGVGIRAVEALQRQYCFPEGVKLIYGGTGGLDLVSMLNGCNKLIIIDAVSGGEQPGSVYLLTAKQLRQQTQSCSSLHEFGILEAVKILEMLGKPLAETIIIGVEPDIIDFGLQLSPAVNSQLDSVLAMAVRQLSDWGFRPVKK